MRAQANRTYKSNDVVMTPPALARALVAELAPSGVLLEPCAGAGAFVEALRGYGRVMTCEATGGEMGFSWWTERVDWVVTNPPWSQFRAMLHHALDVSDHVAFLVTVNHWWTKRRVSDVREHGFGYRDLLLCRWPSEWHATGFQLGMMHIERGHRGPLAIRHVDW